MKRQNKHTHEYFEVKCGIDGNIHLSLNLPLHLYKNFENCFKTSDKMGLLTQLYESYSELSAKQKDTFQMLIYQHADEIIDIPDLICMMHAMVKFFPEK